MIFVAVEHSAIFVKGVIRFIVTAKYPTNASLHYSEFDTEYISQVTLAVASRYET